MSKPTFDQSVEGQVASLSARVAALERWKAQQIQAAQRQPPRAAGWYWVKWTSLSDWTLCQYYSDGTWDSVFGNTPFSIGERVIPPAK